MVECEYAVWGEMGLKIISWNVNGLARCRRNGFLKFLADTKPDVLCCQEIKGQCPLRTPGYLQFWNPAKRANYSGTLTLAKRQPLSCQYGLGIEEFDVEGRLITLEYKDYYIVNVYVPNLNPHSTPDRLDYRIKWDKALKEYLTSLPKPAVVCGDFNVAREYIDIYPENQKNTPEEPLFQSDERAGFDAFIAAGFVDVFRAFYPYKEGAYTWWGPRPKSRQENKGSRLDYFLVSGELLSCIRSVKHHTTTLCSDHCPISIIMGAIIFQYEASDEDLAVRWRTIDWSKMEKELYRNQSKLALAAYNRDWDSVRIMQDKLVESYAAKVLAVRFVADTNSAAGIDGVKLTNDAQKMKMALSLTSRGYRPLPNRYQKINEKGKELTLHIPAARDKAMLVLYSLALDPVAESTADKKSFFARKGRSAHDAFAYIFRELNQEKPPKWIVKADVAAFFDSIMQNWLIENIPMDKTVLRKFLRAGVVKNGEFFVSKQGISFASSLSPILGNMVLDGLQSYIYDGLYPHGYVDYSNGSMVRFADDIVVTARTLGSAEKIMTLVCDFLSSRGLGFNQEKTKIAHIKDGFSFLSWHFQEKGGVLTVEPTDGSIKKIERELENLIMNFKGTQRALIEKINEKLSGWAAYHRSTDAYMIFRHIDAVVEGLLVAKMCQKYSRWHRETVLKKFWISVGGFHIFALPDDPTFRVVRLAPLAMVQHKPCKVSFNPYLDKEYFALLQHRRDEQKANGKYKVIWQRQGGRCAFCGNPMLADQEVEVIEKVIGKGRRVQNLIYIHRQCAYDMFSDSDDAIGEHIDLFDLLADFIDITPLRESPYLELRDFFRLTDKSPLSLTFHQIEEILGDSLPAEAYFFDAFWYEIMPGMTSPMWREEGYPFHAIIPGELDYYISDAWTSQGYEIKALHRHEERVVFRRVVTGVSALRIPKELTARKLPDQIVYKLEKLLKQFVRENGL